MLAFLPKCFKKPRMRAGISPKRKNARWSGRAFGPSNRFLSTPLLLISASKRFAKCQVHPTACLPARCTTLPRFLARIPTVMMFVQSLGGISHNKIEDTREEHLEMSVVALDRLASKTVDWILKKN